LRSGRERKSEREVQKERVDGREKKAKKSKRFSNITTIL
jgi:hypothetical protein